jgi:hypothetical protein
MNENVNLAKWALILYVVSFAPDGSEKVTLLKDIEFVKTEAACELKGLEANAKLPEPSEGASRTFSCIPPGAVDAVLKALK